jgi:phospholipase C
MNVFVLMLENRSFDHMLGFSGLTGTDAVNGQPTMLRGLTGSESNSYGGTRFPVTAGADEAMPLDPGHEFPDVLEQLAGTGASYVSGRYPPINNSGFVSDYVDSRTHGEGGATTNFGEIMKCFAAAQLPVLNALAREFAVCDSWHCAIPGPTWPNRLFACAASSNGLDHSPTTAEILTWESLDGVTFEHGSLFDALRKKSDSGWRIFSGDYFPMAAALKGVTLDDISHFDDFAAQVSKPEYPWLYTWIEPNYGDVAAGTFKGGNSQHPRDGVSPGEALIKATYEAIRNSPHWETSLLIVTWDEHGGFYDHVPPPPAIAPGDTQTESKYNQFGFTFDQYGVRVPAVIVSPRIPRNTIDHRLYDHSSLVATVAAAFDLQSLTARDAAANNVLALLSLPSARDDAPATLPDATPAPPTSAVQPDSGPAVPDMNGTVDAGSLPVLVHVAMRHDIATSPASDRHAILARVQAIQTRQQAADYIAEVRTRVQAAKLPTASQSN